MAVVVYDQTKTRKEILIIVCGRNVLWSEWVIPSEMIRTETNQLACAVGVDCLFWGVNDVFLSNIILVPLLLT